MSTFKGMDNWNWHYAMDFGALIYVICRKTYFCRHIDSLPKI